MRGKEGKVKGKEKRSKEGKSHSWKRAKREKGIVGREQKWRE